MDYWSLPDLEALYLEGSCVLDVQARPSTLTIRGEIALRETHPTYSEPAPGQQYCYRTGNIVFARVTELRWTGQGRPPGVDASGEIDYGSIDEFDVQGGRYRLVGDFGEIVLTNPSAPSLVWQDTGQSPDDPDVAQVTRE